MKALPVPAHEMSRDQLLDLAAEHMDDPDTLRPEYLSAILRLAVERLEPELSDLRAQMSRSAS